MFFCSPSPTAAGTGANSEIVAVEIVRTLVGSIGLVAAVPITTWLAARVVGGPNVDAGTRRAARHQMTTTLLMRRGGVRSRLRRHRRGAGAGRRKPVADDGDPGFWR